MARWKALPVKEISIGGFKGLYESLPATERPLGLLSSVSNLILSPVPSLATVPGTTAMGTALSAAVARGVMQYKNLAGTTVQTLAQAGTQLSYWNGSAWVSITAAAPAKAFTGANLNDLGCLFYAGSAPQKWNGATLAALGGTPPQGEFVVEAYEQLFVAGIPTREGDIDYCDDANPELWTPAATNNAGSITASVNPVKWLGFDKVQGKVLYWTTQELGVINGPETPNQHNLWSVRSLALYGTPNGRTVQNLNGTWIWLTNSGNRVGFAMWSGGAVDIVYLPIATSLGYIIWADIANACSWLDESGRYHCQTPGSPGDTFTKLADPATLPTSFGNGLAFSLDGVYLSVVHAGSPYVTIYKRDEDVFTKLTNPTTLPTGLGRGTAFSSDGVYLSVVHDTSPYVTIYKRSGDTFTKLANPTTLPTGTGYGTAFSSDGVYLSVAHATSPYVTIYKRSGDTFTKLADPATLPARDGYETAFSSDGVYLSVAHNTSPNVTIYKRSGDTFTKLADPATLPANSGYGTAFSSDGVYLSVSHFGSPYVTIYKRSGDTFTKLADPATLPASTGWATAFSSDGVYLTVAHDTSPYVTIYKRSGDTFTKLANPATLPTGNGNGIAISPDGVYLSVGHSISPYVTTYKSTGFREFLYDPVTNGWFTGKSLDVRASGTVSVSGRDVSIIGNEVGAFYKTKGTTNGGTDFDWSVVIGPSTYGADFSDKEILEVVVVMSAEATATVNASFSTTEGGSYGTIKTLTIGTGITKQRFPVPIASGDANNSNVFRLKLTGTGVVTIHDVQLRVYTSGT